MSLRIAKVSSGAATTGSHCRHGPPRVGRSRRKGARPSSSNRWLRASGARPSATAASTPAATRPSWRHAYSLSIPTMPKVIAATSGMAVPAIASTAGVDARKKAESRAAASSRPSLSVKAATSKIASAKSSSCIRCATTSDPPASAAGMSSQAISGPVGITCESRIGRGTSDHTIVRADGCRGSPSA